MLPTSRPIRPIEAGRVSDHAASEISAAAKEDSSPAFVACFVLPRKQAETLYPTQRVSARRIFRPCHLPKPKIPPPLG
jgi:hypothetical protein